MPKEILEQFGYFTEWGGQSWERLCRAGIETLGDLRGREVLEIGARYGKMSVCFALLGANVVGIDISPEVLEKARSEAEKWGVQDRVDFFVYDGKLDQCEPLAGRQFDVIFTKSVLIVMGPALPAFLRAMESLLKPTGRCIFVENRHGGPLFSLLRRVHPDARKWVRRMYYFRPSDLIEIQEVLDIIDVKSSLFPPAYLILAGKKGSPDKSG